MEGILSNLLLGFQNAMTLDNLLWVTIGSFLGTLVGMLPGVGPATGIAILIVAGLYIATRPHQQDRNR